ncbi:EamA family transporter RarD [Sagittula sp. SSi028]|uniref:EamA family transporter RarD n=1 Tax=Sagittula sp. SSi028 TaxID=3400636 RepID=UPI003AF4196E
MSSTTQGVLAMIGACTIWGLSPMYYKLLSDVPPFELLAHRTIWSLLVFAAVLGLQRRLGRLRAALGDGRSFIVVTIAAVMISTNWFLFIFSVQAGIVTQSSLGYYMFPLVAVLLGTVVLKERLSFWQWAAVALAGVAVAQMAVRLGVVPWISLALAGTFGVYGLVKKRLAIGPIVSVTAEVVVLAPVAGAWLIYTHSTGQGVFGTDWGTSGLLALSGALTALPLMLFTAAAQRISLTSVGLIQYLNPTLQFFCAVVIFREALEPAQLVAFALIWSALGLYSGQAVVQDRARRKCAIASVADAPL